MIVCQKGWSPGRWISACSPLPTVCMRWMALSASRDVYKRQEVMCAKPNCRHDSADCSAYVDTTGLYAYNNQLYYVAEGADSKIGLYQMDFGGGNRKELFPINEINELQSYGFTYRIASGYFLLDLQKENAFEAIDTLYLYPLKDKETAPVTIYRCV